MVSMDIDVELRTISVLGAVRHRRIWTLLRPVGILSAAESRTWRSKYRGRTKQGGIDRGIVDQKEEGILYRHRLSPYRMVHLR